MIYLDKFIFPDYDDDTLCSQTPKGSFFDENPYPFHLMSELGLTTLDFDPLTILYGGNGSGKSTVINVIGKRLGAKRNSMFNSGPYFDEYVSRCKYSVDEGILDADIDIDVSGRECEEYNISDLTTVLTSDDIFHSMLDRRQENDNKLKASRKWMDVYCNPEPLPTHLNFETGENVEKYKVGVEVRQAKNSMRNSSKSFNKLILNNVHKMERGFSNGETALMKLSELLESPGLYLLDEPENSMSCEYQIKLASIISYLARYGKCQFVIATHSPFILSMEQAKIYNLDHTPVDVCRWYELDNMKQYFNLFYGAKDQFLLK